MMIYVLAKAIGMFVEIVVMMIVLNAVLSWFVRPGSAGYKLYVTLEGLTEPIVRPFRQLTQGFAYRTGMDFAPVLAIISLYLIRKILISLLFLLV